MFQDNRTLREIEDQFKIVIHWYQEDALLRGDFLEIALAAYQGLDTAFERHLRQKGIRPDEEANTSEPKFIRNAKVAIPEIWETYSEKNIEHLHELFLHPGTDYIHTLTSQDVRDLAKTLVELTIQSWPVLFTETPPQIDEHPVVYSRNDIVDPAEVSRLQAHLTESVYQVEMLNRESEKKDERNRQTETERDALQAVIDSRKTLVDLPWDRFLIGLAFLLPIPLLAGFLAWIWQERPSFRFWLLIPAGAIVALFYYSFRYFWAFFRHTRPLPALAAVCIFLITATLIITPFTSDNLAWYDRPGAALSMLLEKIGRGTGSYVNTTSDLGGLVSRRLFGVSGPDEMAVIDATPTATLPPPSATPTATPWPSRTPTPTASNTPTPTATATATATSTRLPDRGVQVGYGVLVDTSGPRLLVRAEPHSGSAVRSSYANGARLLVIGGPAFSDDFIWWEVQGETGDGWCAGEFLKPEDRE